MKKGVIVYDRADAEYNKWFIEHLILEGARVGLDLSLVLTDEVNDFMGCDFAIMRNRNHIMSKTFEDKGIRCFNSSYVCKIGNDKWEMYRDFSSAGIQVMYTQLSKLPYPFVMKPRDGHGGKNVYLVENEEVYKEICEKEDISNFIYQFVATERGRDIRVYVVGDVILTAMERRASEGEFRANFSLGGDAEEYALNDDELRLVAKVAKHIQADFVGIDIIYNNGKPVINEVEDAVGTRMLYANTDLDPIKEYIGWIAKALQMS